MHNYNKFIAHYNQFLELFISFYFWINLKKFELFSVKMVEFVSHLTFFNVKILENIIILDFFFHCFRAWMKEITKNNYVWIMIEPKFWNLVQSSDKFSFFFLSWYLNSIELIGKKVENRMILR